MSVFIPTMVGRPGETWAFNSDQVIRIMSPSQQEGASCDIQMNGGPPFAVLETLQWVVDRCNGVPLPVEE